MNLILCGMPMCGKSFFGKLLAEHLQWRFIDTDMLIELEQGKSCREITIQYGEPYFRELEKKVIHSLLGCKNSVIAIGGGTLGPAENAQLLKTMGQLIFLKTDISTLYERLMLKPKMPSYIDPNKPRESLEQLAEQRIPIYEKYCDLAIDTERVFGNYNSLYSRLFSLQELAQATKIKEPY